MSLKKTVILSGIFAGFVMGSMASTAFAEDRTLIAEADVKVELDDVQANALEYWPDIERDLEEKLASAIAPHYSGDGYDVTIRLSEISIDGSALLGNEGEFNTLTGWVVVREQHNPAPVERVWVSLTAKTGEVDPEADIVIAPARNAFYNALLDRFAERTVEEIEAI